MSTTEWFLRWCANEYVLSLSVVSNQFILGKGSKDLNNIVKQLKQEGMTMQLQ